MAVGPFALFCPSSVLKNSLLSSGPGWPSHRVILVKVQYLFVTPSYFRSDRLAQILSLIPVLILLVYFLVSIDLVYNGVLTRLVWKESN